MTLNRFMAQTTNPFFNQFYAPNEQSLLNDLIKESIQQYGLEVLYIPRKYVNVDRLYGEDTLSAFEKYYRIESYVANFDSYQGDGEFLSKFGIEIRNEISLNIHIDRFDTLVNHPHLVATGVNLIRPREGDLIYFPIDNRIFEISFTEKRGVFFQLGKLYTWLVRCKQFELSSEKFTTNFTPVDIIEDKYDQSTDIQVSSGFGIYIPGEPVTSGSWTAQTSSWDPVNLLLTVIRQNGPVPVSGIIVGSISIASYSISVTVAPVQNANEVVHNTDDVSVIQNPFIIATSNPLSGGPNS